MRINNRSVIRTAFLTALMLIIPAGFLCPQEIDFVTAGTGLESYKELSEGIYGGIVPRVELLSGVLSHTSWMKRRGPVGSGNDYFRELFQFFEPYKDHDAFKMAEKLTKRGFTYDAPPNFILGLSPLPGLEPAAEYSEYLKNRAPDSRILEEFRLALKDLSAESDFPGFFNSHIQDYEAWIETTFQDFDGIIISAWLSDFFGWPGEQFHIILAPAMFPRGGYGATYEVEGKLIALQIVREYGYSLDQPEFGSGQQMTDLSLHELGHSYVNPEVEGQMKFLEDNHFEEFYYPVEDMMKKQAYGNTITFLNESILRAVTAIAMADLNGTQEYYTDDDKQRGFYLQDYLVEELLEYRSNRETYADFRSFLPVLLEDMSERKEMLTGSL